MAKTFYTERDIVDLHATGATEIPINDDVVLTELAREKATELGLQLVEGDTICHQAGPASPLPPTTPPPPKTSSASPTDPALIDHIKARVMARLGTSEFNDLLDQVIPMVLTRLAEEGKTLTALSSSQNATDSY
ncbi:MAG: hypothetical protein AAF485_14300 [Chloroflexota bacterium]